MNLFVVNERTPFYLISCIFLLTNIILSLIATFNKKTNSSDFFPNGGEYYGKVIHDDSFVDKLCWYFSQLTHHTIFLLFTYFLMALLNVKSEKFFKMVAPLALSISVLYFYFLFPKQKLKIHQLSFSSFFSHFMIIFLIFVEFMYIKDYQFYETTNCLVFIISALLCVWINYSLRGVWSYNIVKLDRFSGWKMVSSTVLLMYGFSVMFYLFKYNHLEYFGFKSKYLRQTSYFFSGIINIVFVLLFNHIYH
jgi:hypothetical protein